MKTFEEAAAFEHQFWLQVLGDHARFILESLVVMEKKDIENAKGYRDIFDTLLKKAREQSSLTSLINLRGQGVCEGVS